MAILVHLSRLREARAALPAGAAVPPHRLHVARTILQEAAQRFEGQVFGLRNGDLALLCRAQLPRKPVAAADRRGRAAASLEPAALPGVLARLFHADMARLISVWPLATEGQALLGYAADRLAEHPRAVAAPPIAPGRGVTPLPPQSLASPASLVPRASAAAPGGEEGALALAEAIGALLTGSRIAELTHSQPAILLHPDTLTGHGKLSVAFRELTFSLAELRARVASVGGPSPPTGAAIADPYLRRHLAGRLDARMLALLLAPECHRPVPDLAAATQPWHLNLTVPAILSGAFARLLDLRQDHPLGVEIAFIDALADPAGFARARSLLADAGVTLVLDGIDDAVLGMAQPWRLGADLIKLDWSPRLLRGAQSGSIGPELEQALARAGAERVVLQRVDQAEGLAWGLAHGITLFQGWQADGLLRARGIADPDRLWLEAQAARHPAARPLIQGAARAG